MDGTLVRQLGTLNMPGIGSGLRDAPCDAKFVGDYTDRPDTAILLRTLTG
jgi:hypothetical protein